MDLSFILFAFSSCCLFNCSCGGVLPPLDVIFEAVGPVRATTIYFPLARGASVFFFFFFFFFFVSASYAAIIFTGNRQNSEGNVNSYIFFVI